MKEIGVIQKSCSLYASSITIVKVLRLDGKWKIRLYSDITDLNKITIKDARPLSNFRIIFNKLGGAIVYMIMDIITGYWQVRIQKEDISKITFITVWG